MPWRDLSRGRYLDGEGLLERRSCVWFAALEELKVLFRAGLCSSFALSRLASSRRGLIALSSLNMS